MRTVISQMLGRLARPRVALLLAVAVVGGVAIGAAQGAVSSASVLGLRLGGDQQRTRVVVDLDASAHGVVPTDAADSGEVVLDLEGAGARRELKGSGLGLVKGWTVKPQAGSARLELELASNAKVARRFLLPPGDGVKTYRYVLDLEPAPGALPQLRRSSGPSWLESFAAVASRPGQPKRLVVIDAGHGGHDPGASGAVSQEKRLTLLAAEALKARLERTGRYRVTLTRASDIYIPLNTRVAIARKAGADLFISLHADSDSSPSVRGASVYTLSEHGAERGARKALMSGDWIGSAAKSDPAVDRILLDLTQRATQNRSAAFARMLLDRLDGRTAILRRSQRDAGFAVLLAPDVPAVLLEMGFITNPDDEQALNDPDRRARIVDGVAEAVDDYFADEGGPTSVAALP